MEPLARELGDQSTPQFFLPRTAQIDLGYNVTESLVAYLPWGTMPFPELIADLVTYEALYTGNHEGVKTGFLLCSYVKLHWWEEENKGVWEREYSLSSHITPTLGNLFLNNFVHAVPSPWNSLYCSCLSWKWAHASRLNSNVIHSTKPFSTSPNSERLVWKMCEAMGSLNY